MNKSEEIKDLAAAMAKAQGEMENASKNAKNPHFRSNYADLAEILNTIRPVLSKHGLSIVQFPTFADGVASVETILLHSSGQWLSNTASAPVDKQNAQGVGSAITYLRRYSSAAVAGLAQEDDDANASIGHGQQNCGYGRQTQPAQKQPAKKEPKPDPKRKDEIKGWLMNADTIERVNEIEAITADERKSWPAAWQEGIDKLIGEKKDKIDG